MNGFRNRILRRVAIGALLAVALGGAAQAQSTWSVTYGGPLQDRLYRILPTPDAGYLLLSGFRNAAGDWDGRLIKVGPTGAVAWAKSYGGPGTDYLYRAVALPDGGFYLAGSTNSFGAGGDDVWLVKVDRDGTPVWQRAYGQAGNQSVEEITLTPEGGLVLVGWASPPGQGNDCWAFKVDPAGGVVWSETVGGAASDYPRSVLALPEGGYAIVGSTYSIGSGPHAWILVLLETGGIDVNWGFATAGSAAYGQDVARASDGAYFVVGSVNEPSGAGAQAMVVKIADNGHLLWQVSLGGADSDEAYSILPLSDGGGLVVGRTASFPGGGNTTDAWATRLETDGSALWQMRYGEGFYDHFEDALATEDDSFLLVGTKALDGPDLGAAWFLKVRAGDGLMDGSCTFANPTAFAVTAISGAAENGSMVPVPFAVTPVDTAGVVSDLNTDRTTLCSSPLNCMLDASATAPLHCTVGLPAAFHASVSATDCEDVPTFAWAFGDGATSSLPNPDHTYAATGTYDWSLLVSASGQSPTRTGTVTAVLPPVVSAIKKITPPFTIVVSGSNLQSGVRVFIDGSEWTATTYKAPTNKKPAKLKLTGGKTLKAAVPKGAMRTFRFVNPDGGEATRTWGY